MKMRISYLINALSPLIDDITNINNELEQWVQRQLARGRTEPIIE